MGLIIPRSCGPNKVIVMSGVCHSEPLIVKGGRVFQIPCVHTVDKLKLNILTIEVNSNGVNCDNGVMLDVQGVAQVKINAEDPESLRLACTNFIGMKEAKINNILTETMEGQQRSIISQMTVEDAYMNREEFNAKVYEGAKPDLLGMGIVILSYTVKSIKTPNGYLKALGTPTIADLHATARIQEALCTRDSDIVKSECKKQTDETKFRTSNEMTKMINDRDLVIANNQKQINTVRATAENAKRLAEAEVNKVLKEEQMQVKLVEKTGEARVMEQEQALKIQQLEHQVTLRAETDKFMTEVRAEAKKTKTILENEAKAAEIEGIGNAEAEATYIKAQAEARATELKALAYEQFGQAALVGEVLKTLPIMARQITEPVNRMNKLSVVTSGDGSIGFQRVVGEVLNIMDDVPEGVHGITGIDLKGEIKKVMTR